MMKKRCAQEALAYIQDGMVIGLGGGSTIAHLARFVKESGKQVQVVTPSQETEALCVELGLSLLPLRQIAHVDIAFDGCDEADRQFYALKSGGGIHVREKLIANMADEYMLLIDESKLSDTLQFRVPIVIELLEDASAYVKRKVEELGGRFVYKHGEGKYGALMSDHGNVLADVWFERVEDARKLNHAIKCIAGVLDTSLLTREVTAILVVSDQGFEVLKKDSDK